MNKTQKGAWVNLAYCLLCVSLIIYLVIEIGVLKKLPGRWFAFWLIPAYLLLLLMSMILMRKKQSPDEVGSDERDKLIQKRAVLASFISVWILLFAVSVIPQFIFGPDATIAVWSLTLVNITVFVAAGLVYCVAVLVQYRQEKNGGGDGGE